MSAARLVGELRARGVELLARGSELHLDAPRGVLVPADLDRLRAAKPEILRLLRQEAQATPESELEDPQEAPLEPLQSDETHHPEVDGPPPDPDVQGAPGATPSMRCGGCGASTPFHPGGLCFACDLGVDRAAFPTKLMPFVLQLRDRLGPAGARGVRVEAIRALAKASPRRSRKRGDRGGQPLQGVPVIGAIREDPAPPALPSSLRDLLPGVAVVERVAKRGEGAVLVHAPGLGELWYAATPGAAAQARAGEMFCETPRPVLEAHDVERLRGKSPAAIRAVLRTFSTFPGSRIVASAPPPPRPPPPPSPWSDDARRARLHHEERAGRSLTDDEIEAAAKLDTMAKAKTREPGDLDPATASDWLEKLYAGHVRIVRDASGKPRLSLAEGREVNNQGNASEEATDASKVRDEGE